MSTLPPENYTLESILLSEPLYLLGEIPDNYTSIFRKFQDNPPSPTPDLRPISTLAVVAG
jgi:hypothetical protein